MATTANIENSSAQFVLIIINTLGKNKDQTDQRFSPKIVATAIIVPGLHGNGT